MNILINATNLKQGGGIQVAQSICAQLGRFPKHRFTVALNSLINDSQIEFESNAKVYKYDTKHNIKSLLLGRDTFLDNLVRNENIDAVLTVFGPSIWRPKVPHLCGFARAQLILKDSPYYQKRSLKEKVVHKIWAWSFRKCSNVFYTENSYISRILENFFKGAKVYTVTNYYNQVFDQPEKWNKSIVLPQFEGVTCLSISNHYLHKNFEIIEGIVKYLKKEHPGFNVRFVVTFDEKEMPIPADIRDSIIYTGKVDVSECPYLYEQCDIMFMPTLMECFTATYPEAMRMGKPIVTTDLEFARGLCGEAACYYSAVDPKAAAEAIYMVATQKEYAARLVENGMKQLLTYDNYEKRAEKLVHILEGMVKTTGKGNVI